jgi:uncharacterized sodium:solute symporter family permease YidK
MAAFGTDYDLMQRLLTVKTRRESQRTLSLTPIGTLVTLAIYLAIGAGLYTYYAQHPGQALPRPDEIFPHFIRTAMPELLRGLMLSAIVLASIDSRQNGGHPGRESAKRGPRREMPGCDWLRSGRRKTSGVRIGCGTCARR